MSRSFPMSVSTPPYDGSEHEDVELLDKLLLSDSALPDGEDIDEMLSPLSTSPTPSYGAESDPGMAILSNIKGATAREAANIINFTNDNDSPHADKKGGRGCAKNRGAIMARENRLKRKLYVQGLEESVSKLRKENDDYKSKVDTLQKAVNSLAEDAAYLKGVLQNQSDLSKILKAVSSVPGITINPSIRCVDTLKSTRKRPASANESCPKKTKKQDTNYGICLHIQNGSVSFELCSHCNAFSSSHPGTSSQED